MSKIFIFRVGQLAKAQLRRVKISFIQDRIKFINEIFCV